MIIKKKNIVYSNKWLKIISKDLEGDKKKIIKKFYSLKQQDYVNIVIQTHDKKFVMVRQYRHSIEKYSLEFPGGLLEKNEDPKNCAIKEVKEETGIDLSYITRISILYPDVGRLSNKLHMFYGKTDSDSSKIKKKTYEKGIKVFFKTKNEIKSLIKSNNIYHQPCVGLFYLGIINNFY